MFGIPPGSTPPSSRCCRLSASLTRSRSTLSLSGGSGSAGSSSDASSSPSFSASRRLRPRFFLASLSFSLPLVASSSAGSSKRCGAMTLRISLCFSCTTRRVAHPCSDAFSRRASSSVRLSHACAAAEATSAAATPACVEGWMRESEMVTCWLRSVSSSTSRACCMYRSSSARAYALSATSYRLPSMRLAYECETSCSLAVTCWSRLSSSRWRSAWSSRNSSAKPAACPRVLASDDCTSAR
mmetsp:Transcript_71871/g.173406  ORF Transcript_71871/g.173406 Transcript_71871/m.173406 type:complete len:241 (-) Transcript_71871:369-1091(-)